MYLKKIKVRDRKYLNYLATRCCVVCGSRQGVCGHHIRLSLGGGTGTKPSDDRCIPLCHKHHIEDLHRHGERQFFNKWQFVFGDNPIAFAELLYKRYLTDSI